MRVCYNVELIASIGRKLKVPHFFKKDTTCVLLDKSGYKFYILLYINEGRTHIKESYKSMNKNFKGRFSDLNYKACFPADAVVAGNFQSKNVNATLGGK